MRLPVMDTGTITDMDHAMKAVAAHPIEAFELADYIGLEMVEAMALNICQDMHQPHGATPHTLTRLVQLGYVGRKTGKGFYDYSVKPPIGNPALRPPVA